MQAGLHTYRVGDATVTKIPELALDEVDPTVLFPQASRDEARAAGEQFGPGSFNRQTGHYRQSIHSWLVRTPNHVILIDTATGNDKDRPSMPVLHQLHEPFLERLMLAGAAPADVDFVLLTHLHADHVGWNTSKTDQGWRPTFANARHVFSARERAYNAALATNDCSALEAIRQQANLGQPVRTPAAGVYQDSIEPVIKAGLAHEVTVDGSEVLDGFTYLPSAGHSIDHASISFTSHGETALFWGDVMHHPVQVGRPDWNSVFCEFPEAARAARTWAVQYAERTNALVFTTHFAESSVGRIIREDAGPIWRFARPEANPDESA